MTELLSNQAYQSVMMLFCGMSTMLIKETFVVIGQRFKLKKKMEIIKEVAFYIIASVLFSKFLYVCAQGKLHFYCVAFYALGLWLWKKCFYDIIPPR